MKRYHSHIHVTKASGELQTFDPNKLRHSLIRSGAKPDEVSRVMKVVEASLHEGMSTDALYRLAFATLHGEGRSLAARYRIKKAIMELGPSGYPFERFIGELLKAQGFLVQVSVLVQGRCVTHEIDVEAEKEGHHVMVECKYHNQQGVKSDVKTALYVHARFQDIRAHRELMQVGNHLFSQAWLVTNTKFSNDAITYSVCAGLQLIGWNYPAQGNLQELITQFNLYPLTCLTSLKMSQKTLLLAQGSILCRDLQHNSELLKYIGLKDEQIEEVLREVDGFCSEQESGKRKR